jgi:Mor family transcriptional regulator
MTQYRRGLLKDFFSRRLSVLGLARKYRLTRKQVEARIRRHLKRKPSERDPDTYINRLLRQRA